MYFQTPRCYDCKYTYGLVLILLKRHFTLLMYLIFLFYLAEDKHIYIYIYMAETCRSSLCL